MHTIQPARLKPGVHLSDLGQKDEPTGTANIATAFSSATRASIRATASSPNSTVENANATSPLALVTPERVTRPPSGKIMEY